MHVSINTAIFENEVKKGKSQLECLKSLPEKLIDSIEVRGEFFNEGKIEEELEEIANLCKENGWKLFYSVPQELFNQEGFNQDIENKILIAEKYNISNLKYSLGHIDIRNTNFNKLNDIPKYCLSIHQKQHVDFHLSNTNFQNQMYILI